MEQLIRYLFLVIAVGLLLGSCASREVEVQTTGTSATGSGVSDAADVNGGPGASAAAAGPIGRPGR